VSRQEFERICADLIPRFTAPIFEALEEAKLGMVSGVFVPRQYTDHIQADVASIVIAGGASRVPMVQAALKATFGEGLVPLIVISNSLLI
jgi:hypoxia up-regulated 1